MTLTLFKVEHMIRTVLQDVAQNGIERKRIEAAMHQIEFSMKHVSVFIFLRPELVENGHVWHEFVAWAHVDLEPWWRSDRSVTNQQGKDCAFSKD